MMTANQQQFDHVRYLVAKVAQIEALANAMEARAIKAEKELEAMKKDDDFMKKNTGTMQPREGSMGKSPAPPSNPKPKDEK